MAGQEIPYFPLMCQLDDKFELIQEEFGLKGFAVVVKLYQKIYSTDGYYCDWSKDVMLLFSRKQCGFSDGGNVVSEILKVALKRGIFSEDLYNKYGILTSKGVQERYFKIACKKKNLKVKGGYLLVNVAQIPANADILSENEENEDAFTQSKVKESKVNESKKSIQKKFAPPSLEEVTEYCNERKNTVNPQAWLDFYQSKGWMVGKNKMTNWKAAVRTWEQRDKQQEQQKQQPKPQIKQNRFVNYNQRNWDFDELERMEREQNERELQQSGFEN